MSRRGFGGNSFKSIKPVSLYIAAGDHDTTEEKDKLETDIIMANAIYKYMGTRPIKYTKDQYSGLATNAGNIRSVFTNLLPGYSSRNYVGSYLFPRQLLVNVTLQNNGTLSDVIFYTDIIVGYYRGEGQLPLNELYAGAPGALDPFKFRSGPIRDQVVILQHYSVLTGSLVRCGWGSSLDIAVNLEDLSSRSLPHKVTVFNPRGGQGPIKFIMNDIFVAVASDSAPLTSGVPTFNVSTLCYFNN